MQLNECFIKKVSDFSVYSLDMLQIGVELPNKIDYLPGYTIKKINKYLKLEKTNRRTPNFSSISTIYYKDLKIGVLKHDPNKEVMHANHAIIYFNNEYLYKARLAGMYKRLKYSMNFKFRNISQIDVAFDQIANESNINWMKKFAKGSIKFLGNIKKQVHYNAQDEIEYFLLGSKKSDKFMRCYHKRQEIAQSNKNYIVDFWNKNGGKFDYESPTRANLESGEDFEVFRTELSLKGNILKKIHVPDFVTNENDSYNPFEDEKTISIIQSAEFLSSIFIRETKNFAKYVRKSELKAKKRTNLVKQYHIIQEVLRTEPIIYLDRIRGEATKHIQKIKMASKFFYQIYIETKNKIYLDLSKDVAQFEQLQKWRQNKIERWEREHSNIKITSNEFKRYLSYFCITAKSAERTNELYLFNEFDIYCTTKPKRNVKRVNICTI